MKFLAVVIVRLRNAYLTFSCILSNCLVDVLYLFTAPGAGQEPAHTWVVLSSISGLLNEKVQADENTLGATGSLQKQDKSDVEKYLAN